MAEQYTEQEAYECYEGDQSKLYSGIMNHHEDIHSKESKAIVRRIVKIMIYLAIVTSAEVFLGLWDHHTDLFGNAKWLLHAIFFVMTLFKAYLIVDVFMHLGDEFKNFVMLVLIPTIFLIWAVIALLGDGKHALKMNNTQAHTHTNTEMVQKQ